MFQYAVGYSLSKKLKQELLLDTTLIKEDQLRNYSLDCFKISGMTLCFRPYPMIMPCKLSAETIITLCNSNDIT